jgi:hypothetical protein
MSRKRYTVADRMTFSITGISGIRIFTVSSLGQPTPPSACRAGVAQLINSGAATQAAQGAWASGRHPES